VVGDDYDVPMDDIELSFQAVSSSSPQEKAQSGETVPASQEEVETEIERESQVVIELEDSDEEQPAVPITEDDSEEETPAVREADVAEDQEEPSVPKARSPVEGEPLVKVVDSKDLDKIDLTNFKFFVLPDNDDDLPVEEHIPPSDWTMSSSQVIIIPEGSEKAIASALGKMEHLEKTPKAVSVQQEEEEEEQTEGDKTLTENGILTCSFYLWGV